MLQLVWWNSPYAKFYPDVKKIWVVACINPGMKSKNHFRSGQSSKNHHFCAKVCVYGVSYKLMLIKKECFHFSSKFCESHCISNRVKKNWWLQLKIILKSTSRVSPLSLRQVKYALGEFHPGIRLYPLTVFS